MTLALTLAAWTALALPAAALIGRTLRNADQRHTSTRPCYCGTCAR